MNEKEFKEEILKMKDNFNFETINKKGLKTQERSKITEGYIEEWLKSILDISEVLIIKAGSQEPYDYILIKKANIENWSPQWKREFKEKFDKDGKVHNLIKNRFELLTDIEKEQILRIEVKAGKGKYIGNDTLPSPVEQIVYFFFDWLSNEIVISPSIEMAKKYGEDKFKYIKEKYYNDLEEIKSLRSSKKEQWKGIGIYSAPRMNYSFDSLYAYVSQDDEMYSKIFNIFFKALWK